MSYQYIIRFLFLVKISYISPCSTSSAESNRIDWDIRFRIVQGICKGLHFLHKEMDKPVVHMDLKPENILLDDNMMPKIADFGLSRLFGEEQTRMNTQNVVGSL